MNPVKHALLATIGASLLLSAGLAAAQETPTTAPGGVTLVDAPAVQKLQAGGAILVDARKPSEYSDGTIKGAISVPYDPEKSKKSADFDASQDKFNLAKLADKNKAYVLFCNSGTCWKSYKAAVVMAKAGYKNVSWYRAGVPDWKSRKLPME